MECVPGHITNNGHWCDFGRFIVQGRQNSKLQYDLQHLQSIGFKYVTSMQGYLTARGIKPGPLFLKQFPDYHLIEIPLADVFHVIGQLYRHLGTPAGGATITAIEPDHVLDLSVRRPLGSNFNLAGRGSSHAQYKAMLDIPAASRRIDGRGVKIAVVDTGLEWGKNTAGFTDIIVADGPQMDRNGHGTAMFEIIKDIAPGAELHAFRVTDLQTLFVWDLLAGMVAAIYDLKADIVTISMGCKRLSDSCPRCGGARGNRSRVSERFFQLIANYPPEPQWNPVIVAAVGNDGNQMPFDWPAKFAGVLAVGSINLQRQVSSFTNVAVSPGEEKEPNEICLCPGGDQNGEVVTEFVGTGLHNGEETKCAGTSPATAYAAGILALKRQQLATTHSGASFLGMALMRAQHDIMDRSGIRCFRTDLHGWGRLVF